MRCSIRSVAFLILLAVSVSAVQAAEPPLAEKYLEQGKLEQGITDLSQFVEKNPQDGQARFGLGVLQFLRSIEKLSQSLYQYGPRSGWTILPGLRLPVPEQTEPKTVSYTDLRKVFSQWLEDVSRAEKTLAGIKGDVKLPLHIGRIRLDLNGDGQAGEDETFWKIYAAFNRQADVTQTDAENFLIAFDTADVLWLRGYCHLLMALDEFLLAHNWKELFERTGHLFFPKVESPYQYLLREAGPRDFLGSASEIADLIAFIHLLHFPVEDKARTKASLGHLEEVIRLSRETWAGVGKETDDDNEWLPGVKQTGVIPGTKITAEMIAGWHDFLAEAEDLLKGKKLVPHWRVGDGRGVNLRRVFLEPVEFDIVLWAQGTAAAPYLEQGTLTKPETWDRLQRIFRGEFIGFALWFN